MNRRRFFGLLAAAPAALAAIARGEWSSYNFRFTTISAPYERPYMIFRYYMTKEQIREIYGTPTIARIGEWHEYYHVSDPELAAALATYKEEVG